MAVGSKKRGGGSGLKHSAGIKHPLIRPMPVEEIVCAAPAGGPVSHGKTSTDQLILLPSERKHSFGDDFRKIRVALMPLRLNQRPTLSPTRNGSESDVPHQA